MAFFAHDLLTDCGRIQKLTTPYGQFLTPKRSAASRCPGGMAWDSWEVAKVALELGGINPGLLTDPKTTPAQRLAMVARSTGRMLPCHGSRQARPILPSPA